MSNVRQQFNSENPPLRASTPISPPDTRTVTMEELEMRMSALFLRQLRQLGLIPGVEQATCPPPPPASYAAQPPRPSAPLTAKTSEAVPFSPVLAAPCDHGYRGASRPVWGMRLYARGGISVKPTDEYRDTPGYNGKSGFS